MTTSPSLTASPSLATSPSVRRGTGTPRLSLNRWTFRTTPLQEFLEATTARGIDAVGLWRQDVAEVGLDALRRRVDDAGLRVSSLCRGGFLTASAEADRAAALADNRRAIDETAALGAPTLVLVVGGVDKADKDLIGARARVTEAVAELAPYAAERGVTLSIEPLHPTRLSTSPKPPAAPPPASSWTPITCGGIPTSSAPSSAPRQRIACSATRCATGTCRWPRSR